MKKAVKKVDVIGVGIGRHTLTSEAREAISRADVLIGAAKVVEAYKEKRTIPLYLPKDVAACIENEDWDGDGEGVGVGDGVGNGVGVGDGVGVGNGDGVGAAFAVLVSGDVGFYSAAAGLCEALPACELRFIPGISTVNAFFAKLRMPWQDAAFVSAHGRDANVVDAVRRNRLTFCLAGNNVNEIGVALCKAGFGDIKAHIGEDLGTERERVFETSAQGLSDGGFSSLTALLLVNEASDDRTPCGLPDGAFARHEGLPMTKSETRAVAMSKLGLRPNSVCWDIGAGTGSVAVEMALSAYRGHVFAVERRADATPFIEQNCAAFHVGNVTVVCGEAPAALEPLPAPNAVFIGGSGGELGEIIASGLRKNPEARIVVSAVTIETVPAAMSAFGAAGLEPQIIQINVARGKRAGKLHLMEAQNPVAILSAGGRSAAGGGP